LGLLALLASAPAALAQPVSMHIGGDARRMTREVCARKAVEVLGVKEKFTFAEVTRDGHAWGYNGRAAVLVLSFPHPAGIQILIIAASKDNAEAERLRNVVRAHVFEGAHDPSVPPRVGKKTKPSANEVTLRWRIQQRPLITPLRFFDAVASIVLEKKSYTLGSSGSKEAVVGASPARVVFAFSASSASAFLRNLGVVTACEAGDDEPVSEKVLSAITQVIYE
jgi:hypothetical protein